MGTVFVIEIAGFAFWYRFGWLHSLEICLSHIFLLVDRSFCACGKIPELFKNYMRALKIYLCYIFPHNHTYSGITGN